MDLWQNNTIQFSRLISEIESNGGFTVKLVKALSKSMDLTIDEVWELIDRAKDKFDLIKRKI